MTISMMIRKPIPYFSTYTYYIIRSKAEFRFRFLLVSLVLLILGLPSLAFAPAKVGFTSAEQQQVVIATPGLFERSNAFNVDFIGLGEKEYSFPLPVGKVVGVNNGVVRIETKKGDAVKAMFAGHVRLSRKIEGYGNVVVVRHDNGIETVYAYNAENLVKVGQSVTAGQTLAIVGGKNSQVFCDFSMMVNGARLNPETLLDLKNHKLRRQTLQFRKAGNRVNVSVVSTGKSSASTQGKKKSKTKDALTLDPDEVNDPFVSSDAFELDLQKIEANHWAYPLSGAKVISPYGGSRRHSGVDLKTRPNDDVVAAFDGVVVSSGPFSGYGNCIRVRHAYGFETLYSHQSKNLVRKGDKVKAGQVIGLTGRTGRATTEHLHFEVHFKGKRLNPAILFDHVARKLQASVLTLTKSGGVKKRK